MKSVIIISCFNWYEARLKSVKDIFEQKGYTVKCYISDFDHMNKETISDRHVDCDYIKTLPYTRNLSLRRIISHFYFAKNIANILFDEKPDYIYALVPPNMVSFVCAKYKRKNKKCKLIFDILDLWPETMTIGKGNILYSIPFKFWKYLRNSSIIEADHVFMECDLFRGKLMDIVGDKSSVLHLYKKNSGLSLTDLNSMDSISLCYLGSINNIIDIDLITELVVRITKYKPVTLHLIAKGEKKSDFLNKLNFPRVKICDYGCVYNVQDKFNIYSLCHFGINIMKSSVCVGLTMKSMDYFEAGLPLINNIPHDTYDIIEKYESGFNINSLNLDEIVYKVLTINLNDYQVMRMNTKLAYEAFFTKERFIEKVANNI